MTFAVDLDIAARGSFAFKTPIEGKKILDHILEKHPSSIIVSKPLLEKAMSCIEESSLLGILMTPNKSASARIPL
jgi:hypothetical protein